MIIICIKSIIAPVWLFFLNNKVTFIRYPTSRIFIVLDNSKNIVWGGGAEIVGDCLCVRTHKLYITFTLVGKGV